MAYTIGRYVLTQRYRILCDSRDVQHIRERYGPHTVDQLFEAAIVAYHTLAKEDLFDLYRNSSGVLVWDLHSNVRIYDQFEAGPYRCTVEGDPEIV